MVWGGEGITELAKEISTQVKTLKKPRSRAGPSTEWLSGPEQVDDITKLPSREVLIGQVIALLLGPAQQTLSLLSSSASTVVGQLEALAKRGRKQTHAARSAASGGRRVSARRPCQRARARPADIGSIDIHVICRDDNRSERIRLPDSARLNARTMDRGLES